MKSEHLAAVEEIVRTYPVAHILRCIADTLDNNAQTNADNSVQRALRNAAHRVRTVARNLRWL